MEHIIRKGIAFDQKQLHKFDQCIARLGYANRSEAIRDLIREKLIDEDIKHPESTMMATLTIVYNHHDHDVQHNITHIQHHAPSVIVSTLHTHIDEDNCLEVLVLRGKVSHIKKLSGKIISAKGVKHGKLVLTKAR